MYQTYQSPTLPNLINSKGIEVNQEQPSSVLNILTIKLFVVAFDRKWFRASFSPEEFLLRYKQY
jgi:hypothetical protein